MQLQTILCCNYIYDMIFMKYFLKLNTNYVYVASESAPTPQRKILSMGLERKRAILMHIRRHGNFHSGLTLRNVFVFT